MSKDKEASPRRVLTPHLDEVRECQKSRKTLGTSYTCVRLRTFSTALEIEKDQLDTLTTQLT
jgi:hypothetical protein